MRQNDLLCAQSRVGAEPTNAVQITTAVTRAPHVGLAATVRDGIARSRRFRLRPATASILAPA